MSNYEINQQDYAILNFIASKESKGQYSIVYPSTVRPEIIEYTINMILDLQNEMVKSSLATEYSRASSVGRYQLIKDQVKSAADSIGLDKELTKFSKDIQDAMCIQLIKDTCDYEKWLLEEIETEIFQFKLAGQFESIPLSCSQNDDTKRLGRIGSLEAQHDCDTTTDELDDIRSMDPGAPVKIPIQINTTSGVSPAEGNTLKRIAENATAGTVVTGGHSGFSQNTVTLPSVDNPYQYEPVDPFDDRYDFRTGKKVIDIGINGTSAATNQSTPGSVSTNDTPSQQVKQPPPTQGPDDGSRQSTPELTQGDDILFQQPLTASGSQAGSQPLPTNNATINISSDGTVLNPEADPEFAALQDEYLARARRVTGRTRST